MQMLVNRSWLFTILTLCLALLFTLSLIFVSGEIVSAKSQNSLMELPKPEHKTTPPLYQEWRFDKEKTSSVPEGFRAITIGEGKEGRWEVKNSKKVLSPTAFTGTVTGAGGGITDNVLMQLEPCSSSSCYQLLLAKENAFQYVDLSVRIMAPFSSPSGAGGIVLRATDSKNFYALTVAPFTNTVQLIQAVDGQITLLGQQTTTPDPFTNEIVTPQKGEWHFLRVNHRSMMSKEIMEIFFDNHMILSHEDTVKGRGKVGLLTTGDSVFAFDNLRAMELLSGNPLSRPPAY